MNQTSRQTLRNLADLPAAPPMIDGAVVVVIDAQREYLDGQLQLTGIDDALDRIERVLGAARSQQVPVVHVAQRGRAGGLFAPTAGGIIIERVGPVDDEVMVSKSFPNAFADTDLREVIGRLGDPPVVLCGFMTHMCISSTARAALDLGIDTTVIADACATRPLPSFGAGDTITADVVHQVALTELADRFSIVTDTSSFLRS